jgi:GTPase SAR1 family protein
MVYDVTNPASFEDVDKFWINEVESYAEKNVELLLIGNKSDLDKGYRFHGILECQVKKEKTMRLQKEWNLLRLVQRLLIKSMQPSSHSPVS